MDLSQTPFTQLPRLKLWSHHWIFSFFYVPHFTHLQNLWALPSNISSHPLTQTLLIFSLDHHNNFLAGLCSSIPSPYCLNLFTQQNKASEIQTRLLPGPILWFFGFFSHLEWNPKSYGLWVLASGYSSGFIIYHFLPCSLGFRHTDSLVDLWTSQAGSQFRTLALPVFSA